MAPWRNGRLKGLKILRPALAMRVQIPLELRCIEIWCNGSTSDFGSDSLGSNPNISTNMFYNINLVCSSKGQDTRFSFLS